MTRTPPSRDEMVGSLCAMVQPDRLARRTTDLVSIPSPSGEEAAAADEYAGWLEDAGLTVEFDREFPESPSLVARTRPRPGRPVLQLAGHLDTISTAHSPPRYWDGVISGRGACDMKGGLAVTAEVAQILSDSEVPLAGSLLVTAHGQHEEAANGRPLHAPLLGLLRRGIRGSACIIPEGPHETLPVAGRGLVIFKSTFSREGDVVHEILGGDDPPPNPIMACHGFVQDLAEASRTWTTCDPLAGRDSYFIGAISGGDYYNRIPSSAYVWGTRRYPPGVEFDFVRLELIGIAERAAAHVGCTVDLEIEKSGQPFSVPTGEPLVRAVRDSFREQTGRDLPLAGMQFSADSSQFINVAGIPALYHGTNSATAHSDHESVAVADLERCARVLLGSVVNYLGVAE